MEGNCTLLLQNPYRDFRPDDIIKSLRSPETKSKITAMTKIITAELNGDHHPELLMEVIQNIMPCTKHQIKRLVLIYLESIERTKDGQLRPELILAINGLLHDLSHPNEYIRGVTLKFLCHVGEKDILQPLIPSIIENLTHRSSYVRKATADVLGHIYVIDSTLVEHASDSLRTALKEERDTSSRVVIFNVLTRISPEVALKFIVSITQQITTFSSSFVLTVLHFIRRVHKSTPAYKPQFVGLLSSLLSSPTLSVKYETASLFPYVTGASSVIKASLDTLVDVVCSSSDINIKTTGITRIKSIANKYPKVVRTQCVSSILRMLPYPVIRVEALTLVMNCLAPRTASEIVNALRKEITKDDNKYVSLVIKALRRCKQVNETVNIDDVMFGAVTNSLLADDVLGYIEERLEKDQTQETVLKLLGFVEKLNEPKSLRSVLWMICEFANDSSLIVLERLKNSIIKKNIPEENEFNDNEEFIESKEVKVGGGNVVVLPDGTYGSSTIEYNSKNELQQFTIGLRGIVEQLDNMLIGVLAVGLSKLVLRKTGVEGNRMRAMALQIILEIMKLDKESNKLTNDTKERIQLAIMVITKKAEDIMQVALALQNEVKKEVMKTNLVENENLVQVDDKIHYELFSTMDEEEEAQESRIEQLKGNARIERLNNIVQLSGYSDPFYIEAVVLVTHFDITLDCLIINQTPTTLQNIAIEFIPHGGMKIKTKPSPVTLGPGDFVRITLGIQVDATTIGVISGYVNYDISDSSVTHHALDCNLILNEIRIEYLDQMTPSECSNDEYQKKWIEYEWENKIPIDTNLTNLKDFAELISKIAKLKCLTPTMMFCHDIGFLSANYYAKNIFDEDVLVNLSAELAHEKIIGWIRIRSKTQSLAVNIGDRILANQKNQNK
ncbi:Coatomer subunit beta [Entamoeba marina]